MSYRSADILVHETKAGVLEETETGYRFQYAPDYLSIIQTKPVSLTLPLQEEPYESRVFLSFIDGLISQRCHTG